MFWQQQQPLLWENAGGRLGGGHRTQPFIVHYHIIKFWTSRIGNMLMVLSACEGLGFRVWCC